MKKVIWKPFRRSSLSSVSWAVVIATLLLACNDKKKNDTVSKKAYPVVLKASDLIDLFAENNERKMIFLEFGEESSEAEVILRARVSNSNGQRVNGIDIPLEKTEGGTAVAFEYNTAYPYFNVLTRGHVKKFLGYTNFNDVVIPSTEFDKDVLLTPCLRANGKIEYVMTFLDAEKPECEEGAEGRLGRMASNPSPPGSAACAGDCDNPDFSFLKK